VPLSRNLGTLNFLEPSGPLQACNGTDVPLIIRLINLLLFSVSFTNLQLFMVLLRSFWNLVVIFPFILSAPLFEIKSETFC